MISLSVSTSLYDTIESISIPDDYIYVSLHPSIPELEMSYYMRNYGIYDLSDLTVNVSLDLIYFEQHTDLERQAKVFSKSEIMNVPPMNHIEGIFVGGIENFDTESMAIFWNTVNESREVRYLFTFEIDGKYCFGTIPFSIYFQDFGFEEESGCDNCGG